MPHKPAQRWHVWTAWAAICVLVMTAVIAGNIREAGRREKLAAANAELVDLAHDLEDAVALTCQTTTDLASTIRGLADVLEADTDAMPPPTTDLGRFLLAMSVELDEWSDASKDRLDIPPPCTNVTDAVPATPLRSPPHSPTTQPGENP